MSLVQGGAQAIQQAQQFAQSLGLGGQPQQTQPAPSTPPSGDQRVGGDGMAQQAPQPATQPTQPWQAPPIGMPAPAHLLSPQSGVPAGPPQPATVDQLAPLLQALQQHQIPPLPQPTAAAPQITALDLLRIMLTNAQLQQALQTSAMPRAVTLRTPVAGMPGHVRPTQVPLGAVMNAIALLAGQSMTELNEFVSEEEPEIPDYLVDARGDFIVDPASADDRAALVAHLFRVHDTAERLTWGPEQYEALEEGGGEVDESEEWAREAGLS